MALTRGDSIGCDTIQMLVRNANRWSAPPLTAEQVDAFAEARQTTGITPIVVHSSYLINLASPQDALWHRSLNALIEEMERCRRLSIGAYVLHPGAHTGSGEEAGLLRVVAALDAAFEETAGSPVRVLLEITAGQGTVLGARFEELAWIADEVAAGQRVGVCFDTAHAFAAGYDFGTPEAYAAMWASFDETIGLDRLGALHLNDSRRELGSRVDRHAHIGEGEIGLAAFALLVNDPELRRAPMILETPKGPDLAEDIENLARLRGLIGADPMALGVQEVEERQG
jgi:deoxyribonuclease-4